MITLAALVQRVPGVDAGTLRVWIAQEWVRPRHEAGEPAFEEIDVARVRLIVELRDELEVGEPAIPVVLSLLDQLHAAHGRLSHLRAVLEGAGEGETVRDVMRRLG